MARKIGALATTLTLKSQSFTRGLKKARFSIQRFGRSMRSMVGRLKSFSLVSGVSVGAFGFLVRQQLKAADASAKLSARLGISIGALEGFRLAAELGGASVEGADNALQQFARRLGDAQGGTGEYADAIKELGLNSSKLAAVPLDVALGQVADKIKGLGNVTLKANVAYNLFGRQGIKLLNTLADGSEGLKKVRKEIEGTGLAISRFDARKIERANDAMTRLKFAVAGFARVVGVDLAPAIEGLANALSSLNFQTLSLGPNIIELGRGIVKVASFVSQSFVHLAKPFIGLSAIFEGVTTGSLKQSRETIKSLEDALEFLDFNSIDDFFNPIADAAVNTAGAIDKTTKSVFNLSKAFGKSGKRSPFSAAIEIGSQAAAKATFKFNQDASAAQNASLALGREILRVAQKIERQIGTPNTQVRIG